ncbi:MAG: hypothetical protein V1719_01540 [Patescibacteria group bacterium]
MAKDTQKSALTEISLGDIFVPIMHDEDDTDPISRIDARKVVAIKLVKCGGGWVQKIFFLYPNQDRANGIKILALTRNGFLRGTPVRVEQ